MTLKLIILTEISFNLTNFYCVSRREKGQGDKEVRKLANVKQPLKN